MHFIWELRVPAKPWFILFLIDTTIQTHWMEYHALLPHGDDWILQCYCLYAAGMHVWQEGFKLQCWDWYVVSNSRVKFLANCVQLPVWLSKYSQMVNDLSNLIVNNGHLRQQNWMYPRAFKIMLHITRKWNLAHCWLRSVHATLIKNWLGVLNSEKWAPGTRKWNVPRS